MESNSRTRRRFVFNGIVERRSLTRMRNNRSCTWKRIKNIGVIAAIVLCLLLFLVFYSVLESEQNVQPKHVESIDSKRDSDSSQSFETAKEDFSKRYSKNALASKPHTRFKFNEQHKRILSRFQKHADKSIHANGGGKQNTFFRTKRSSHDNDTSVDNSTMSADNSTVDLTTAAMSDNATTIMMDNATTDVTMTAMDNQTTDFTVTAMENVTETTEMFTTEEMTTEDTTEAETTDSFTFPITMATGPATRPPIVITVGVPFPVPIIGGNDAAADLASARSLQVIFGGVAGGAGAIALFLLILLLIICCCPCQCCFLCFCCRRIYRKRDIETVDASTLAVLDSDALESSMWIAKEELLRDAMEVGKVPVLEFAIQEAHAYSDKIDEALVDKAETRLNLWKRTLNLLDGAYKSKDMIAMADYQKRFEDLEIQDDSGIFQRTAELQDSVQACIGDLVEATELKDESKINAAIDGLEKTGLPLIYINNLPEVKQAQDVLNNIKHEKILLGKSSEEMETALRQAMEHRNSRAISLAISQIEAAGLIKLNPLVEEAKRIVKELQEERENLRDEAWTKLQDASQQRNGPNLREALRQCAQYGVEEEQIKAGEKLLKVVEREDQLLEEMRKLIELRDSSKLLEAIAVFRTPGLMMIDKTGDVARADDLLRELREKERLQRAKGDVMFRLQTALDSGQIDVLEHMIKALENIASMGEEIDEAVLNRAKTKLEEFRGSLDYRLRMERIKSAIGRMAAAEKLSQLSDLINQMVELADHKQFTMTSDDLRVLDDSRVTLHDLKRKHAILDEIETIRPSLTLPQVPDSLEKLSAGVETMSRLKESAAEFKGAFTLELETLLATASLSASQLQAKVDERNKVQENLRTSMENKDHEALLLALDEGRGTEFIDEAEIQSAQNMCDFINPVKRVAALKAAIKSRDRAQLTQAIADFKEAGVPDQAILLETAERRLKKVKKLEKKLRKEDKQKRREERRRQAEINELNFALEVAMEARDTDLLQDALEKCENSGYSDKEIPLYTQAEELLDQLTIERLRNSLQDAMERRDILNLEKGVDQAEYGGYVNELGEDYHKAKDLLYHLRELHRLREAISGMNRSLISEIYRYPTPPEPVAVVMTAALVMLGEKRKNLTKWSNVQALIGKIGDQSVTRRVRRCAPGDITPEVRNEVENLLGNLDIDNVQDISKGAAAFFAWMQCMIKESFYATTPRGGVHLPPSGSTAAKVQF